MPGRWALLTLLLVHPALGQALGPAEALHYRAPAGCGDEAQFRAQVAARTTIPMDGSTGRRLWVEVTTGEGIHGRLVAFDEAGATVVRDVEGASCDEVVRALALIGAVILEGRDAPAAEAVPPPVVPTAPPPPVVDARREAPPEPPSAGRAEWSAGLHGAAQGGVGPTLAFGPRAFVDLADATGGWLSPSARLSFVWTLPRTTSTPEGDAELTWMSARLEACPVRLRAGIVDVAPCASFDAGRIGGAGSQTDAPAEPARWWMAPGALSRVAVSLTRHLALEAELGVSFPLSEYRFFFAPSPPFYEVPRVAGAAGLGVAFRFR
jgi:hypothetical protein